FRQNKQMALKTGQEGQLGEYTFRQQALTVTEDAQKQAITATVLVLKNGKPVITMNPAKWSFRKGGEQTTEVAIQRGLTHDIYIVLGSYKAGEQTAMLDVFLVPLVDWIWIGFAVIAMGTLIALMPDTVFAFAYARIPAEAVTTALLVLALALAP